MWSDINLRLASALLFEGEVPAGLSRRDLSSLIPLLRGNRVPVALLPRASELVDIDSSGTVAQYFASEKERYDRQLAAYLEVAAAWVSEGIEGVLIKSPGYFPYTSSNVDVLVPTDRALEACRILEGLRYAELSRFREPYKRLFRRSDQPYLGFPIHVHTAVAWINRFLTGAEVLRERRRSGDSDLLLYPSPENVFVITTAHWLYEDKELTLRDVYHASQAVSDGVEWNAVRRRADGGGWRQSLEFAFSLYAITAERFGARAFRAKLPASELKGVLLSRELERASRRTSTPVRLSKPLLKALHLAKTATDPKLSPAAMLQELSLVVFFAAHAKLPSARNGVPVVVSLSGPDGAGKTTLARALQDLLEREVGVAAWYHWQRLGTSSWLDSLRPAATSLLRASRTAPPLGADGAGVPPGRAKLLLRGRPRLRAAWSSLLLADFLLRLWTARSRCRLVGGIHIFDREAIDAAVDLEAFYGFGHPRLVVGLAPSPTVQILLKPSDWDGGREAPTAPATGDGEILELYRQYEQRADAVMTAREPIESLLDRAARLVVTAVLTWARARPS